ncbi:MAG: 50S ribosomal protein L10 [Candidatus Aureabacteria bacterium]|nr:50S ribosomal protein L10 [Candidatus Auribacterota bacterium]
MRPERQIMIKEMKEKLKETSFFFVTNYQGLNVSDMTMLRDQLKEKEAVYHIFKNRLFKRIVGEKGYPSHIENDLKGFSAFAIGGKDVVQVAKILTDFAKKHESFAVKAGVIENRYISREEVRKIASLPSREIMIARTVSTIAAPLTGFVFVLHERIRSFVGVLAAIADKKKEQSNA